MVREVVCFLDNREEREALGYDFERCIREHVPPLPLRVHPFPKLTQLLQYRKCRPMWPQFNISFFVPDSGLTVRIGMNFQNPVDEFSIAVVTETKMDPAWPRTGLATRVSREHIFYWPEDRASGRVSRERKSTADCYFRWNLDYIVCD